MQIKALFEEKIMLKAIIYFNTTFLLVAYEINAT